MSQHLIKEEKIIEQALDIIDNRFNALNGEIILSSESAKSYASLKLSAQKKEVFAALFLNTQGAVMKYIEFFYGTIDQCSVYPREILRACIEYDVQKVILMHNHPSGLTEPSQADRQITRDIMEALKYIDVAVIDHLIFGGSDCYSFAERGILPVIGR